MAPLPAYSTTSTQPISSSCYYRGLVLSFAVFLVGGALTFAGLERDGEVQKRFKLSEIKREFAQQYSIGGAIGNVLIIFIFMRRKLRKLIKISYTFQTRNLKTSWRQ